MRKSGKLKLQIDELQVSSREKLLRVQQLEAEIKKENEEIDSILTKIAELTEERRLRLEEEEKLGKVSIVRRGSTNKQPEQVPVILVQNTNTLNVLPNEYQFKRKSSPRTAIHL